MQKIADCQNIIDDKLIVHVSQLVQLKEEVKRLSDERDFFRDVVKNVTSEYYHQLAKTYLMSALNRKLVKKLNRQRQTLKHELGRHENTRRQLKDLQDSQKLEMKRALKWKE